MLAASAATRGLCDALGKRSAHRSHEGRHGGEIVVVGQPVHVDLQRSAGINDARAHLVTDRIADARGDLVGVERLGGRRQVQADLRTLLDGGLDEHAVRVADGDERQLLGLLEDGVDVVAAGRALLETERTGRREVLGVAARLDEGEAIAADGVEGVLGGARLVVEVGDRRVPAA